MALVGPGFIARHHIDCVRRLGDVDVIGIAGSSPESAQEKARELNAGRAYSDYNALIADSNVDVVHVTTPNCMHFSEIMMALQAGKHVISDKPLAMNADEARNLRDAAHKAGVAHVVTFNYRGNPMVQQARAMIARGDTGPISFVHGHYLQDWMADPNVYSWRSDPGKAGPSSALADIGSHWCDLAEHVTGMKIESVLADFSTVLPVRFAAEGSAHAFDKGNALHRTPVQVNGEDLVSALLRFENGAKGAIAIGQVLPGHKNNLRLEVNGTRCSLGWDQESQNELWLGRFDEANSLLTKDPGRLLPEAAPYARLPAGHQESWSDAFFNLIDDAYGWIRQGGAAEAKPALLPTFDDGYRSACIVEAMIRSHAGGGHWEKVQTSCAEEMLQAN
jgi:predicted dehydrogenase